MLNQLAFAKQLSRSLLHRPDAPPLTLQNLREARAIGLWQVLYDHWEQTGQLPRLELTGAAPWMQLARDTRKRLQRYKNQWAGQTVVCVGNGPSINRTNIGCLNDAYVIGTNRAFLLLDQFTPRSFHLAIQDNHRLQELQDAVRHVDCHLHVGCWVLSPDMPPPEWITATRKDLTVYFPKVKWVSEGDALKPEGSLESNFSEDPTTGIYYGCSVIFSAIQFAAYFGAKRIVCIGIDMDFTQGISFAANVPHIWTGFDYEKYAKPMFQKLRQVLEERGIELINATPGGAVEELRRMPLEEALKR